MHPHLTFRCPPKLARRVDAAARRLGISRTDTIIMALTTQLDALTASTPAKEKPAHVHKAD